MKRILDSAPLGTLVIRDGRIRYASAAALRLLGFAEGEVLGRPYEEFLAPERRAGSLERHDRRLRGAATPAEFESEVVRKDGTRLSVEVFVTRDGPELVAQLRDLSGACSDRDRLIELARLGAEIQRERSAPALFDLLRWGLERIGVQSALLVPEGDALRVEWSLADPRLRAEAESEIGRGLAGLRARWSTATRAAWRDGVAFVADVPAETEELLGPELGPRARALAERLGLGNGISLRIEQEGQPRFLLHVMSGWLRTRDLAAFRLFGAQVSAALDAGVTISDLSQRNAELAALNALAELGGRVQDLPAFLSAAAEVVRRALDCQGLALWLAAPASEEAELAFEVGGASPRRLPLRGTAIGEVAASGVAAVSQGDAPGARLPTRMLVPLKIRSTVLGVLEAGYERARPEAECPLELLRAMGAHFAGAVENQRLLSDLRGRVSELILLNDLALATATLDPVLLFENALRRMMATLGADAAAAYLLEGSELRQKAVIGFGEEAVRASRQVALTAAPLGLAVTRLAPVHVPDTARGDALSRFFREKDGIEAEVALPLQVKDRALGAFLLARRQPRPFAPEEIQLLSAVGAQLAVAVENARLFEDTRRRASDLEAVNALALEVFGSPLGDPLPLLEAACRRLTQALSARATVVFLVDEQAQKLRGVAAHGQPLPPAGLDIPLHQGGLAAEALRTQEPVVCADTATDPRSSLRGTRHPPMAMLVLPLTSRRSTRGVVVVSDELGRAFTDEEISLAYALAGEAAMGLENAELYAQERQRGEELGMVLEVGRSLASTLDLDAVLEAGVRNLARIVDATDAMVLLPDASGARLEVRAVAGAPELLGRTQPLDQPGVAPWVFLHQRPLLVEDGASDPRVDPRFRELSKGRAYLAVPLTVRGRAIGSAVMVEARGPRHFTQPEAERASAIANQLAVAVENARLYADLRRSYADLARAQAQLVHRERLAALGELSAVVAHEVRNPLGVIFNSLGSLKRLLRPEGDAKLLLDIVGEEADRLNRMVGDLLDFARPQVPVLRAERIERVVDEAVMSALAQRGQGLHVEVSAEPGLPPVAVDARLLRQALVNLALNGAQAMPQGGTLRVRVKRTPGDGVEIAVSDAGPGIAPEVRHRIFEPFFTTKATGTGIGLAVVKRIVDEHHAEIAVESEPGRGTTFRIKLPAAPPPPPAGGDGGSIG